MYHYSYFRDYVNKKALWFPAAEFGLTSGVAIFTVKNLPWQLTSPQPIIKIKHYADEASFVNNQYRETYCDEDANCIQKAYMSFKLLHG